MKRFRKYQILIKHTYIFVDTYFITKHISLDILPSICVTKIVRV